MSAASGSYRPVIQVEPDSRAQLPQRVRSADNAGNAEQQADEPEILNRGSDGRVVARNFSALMVSQFVSWGLAIAGVIVIPRYLGAELVGRLHVSNSLWAIGIVIASFGMNLFMAKDIARQPGNTGTVLATTTAVRLMLVVPTAVVLFGYALVAGYPSQTLMIMAILGVAALVSIIGAGLTAVLQGLERMKAMSVASVVYQFVVVGGGIALLLAGHGVYAVALAFVVGALVKMTIEARALRRLRRETGDHSPFRADLDSMRAMVRTSAPYFGVGFFVVLYKQVDAVVISLVVENDEVLGWYSVYDRFAGTLLFVPTVFVTAVYPTLSRVYADETRDYTKLTQRSFRLMLLISVPLGFGLATVARPLIVMLVGEDFTNAGPVMAVGGVVISLTYLNTVFGTFLVSMDRQKMWTRVIALGALLTIPLDLVLVPFFQSTFDNGAIGGAVAYLITESVVLAAAIRLLPRGSLPASSPSYAARVVLAGLVAAGAMLPLRDEFILIPIAVGAVVYILMAAALRLVADEDRELITGSVQSMLARRKEARTP